MASSIHKRARAKRDLVEHYVYFAEHAGTATAERFLLNAERSFGDLSKHPGMGVSLDLRSPMLAGMRKWKVRGFEKILIFYLPRAGGVSIVRVLHASQDWWSLLGIL
jgi:toxin ParE1/3/4